MRGEKGLRETRGGNRSPVSVSGFLRRQGSLAASTPARVDVDDGDMAAVMVNEDVLMWDNQVRGIDEECGLVEGDVAFFMPE